MSAELVRGPWQRPPKFLPVPTWEPQNEDEWRHAVIAAAWYCRRTLEILRKQRRERGALTWRQNRQRLAMHETCVGLSAIYALACEERADLWPKRTP
jgi:hypothetical protein